MRALKRPSRGARTRTAPETTGFVPEEPYEFELDDETAEPGTAGADEDVYDIFRVSCPDCGRPIALLDGEERLPEHALCSSPWNPFGLTVCTGSGRSVADAHQLADDPSEGQDLTALLTLPAGLDWRTQPFSHAGGPGAPPARAPRRTARRH